MTDPIDQRLEEIEANVPSTITGSGKCECQACQEKLALCKALRRANNIISECDPDTVFGWEMECAAILSGEEGK